MQNLTISGFVPAFCLLLVAGGSEARAGTITLTIGGADTGSVTLTETGNNSLITAISGTFDGSTIGSLISPGGLGINDNLFYLPAPYLDNSGVSFTLTTPDTDGHTDVNLYYLAPPNGSYYVSEQSNSPTLFEDGADYSPDTVTANGSGVPEPATICLTLGGIAGFLAARRRGR